MSEHFDVYMKAVGQALAQGQATEHTYRPALKALLEAHTPGVTATNEPKRVACGAPDFVIETGRVHDRLIVGYAETKDLGADLNEIERSEQLQRYRAALPNLLLTNYLEFRWYVDGERRLSASLAHVGGQGRVQSETNGAYEVGVLLDNFLTSEPVRIGKAKDLALRMARLSHLIRDVIIKAFEEKHASQELMDLRQAFAKTLIPDLMEPGKTAEFADMYAQTIAYGLFAARCFDKTPENFSRDEARHLIPKTNPFLRKLFEMISGNEMDEEPYAGFVDDLVQLLGRAQMDQVLADFGRRTARQDPVVHFYETFLAAYDPALRKARGVYYTPEPVVSYIVRSVDHLLKTRFGCPGGLSDTQSTTYSKKDEMGHGFTTPTPRVLLLDPACGTGTFLYAVVDQIRSQFMREGNAGLWSGYVRNHLLPRLFGFELLMAPYSVAHFKIGMALAGLDLPEAQRKDWAYDFATDERLGIYLTNSLEEALKIVVPLIGPLRSIAEEANAAEKVKRELPVLVVMGNPPYAGHSANASKRVIREAKGEKGKDRVRVVDTFIGALLKDYYKADGNPLGEKNPKWLQDDYVKFLRFGQWRIEQTGSGILAFITNHGYLDNPTFRGMRQSLMSTFDDIYLLDLHGNSKKKEKAPDGGLDKNVFDIQQGVAIALMVRHPRQPEEKAKAPATVRHAELWGPREGKEGQGGKYGWLFEHHVQNTPWQELHPRSPQFLFVPQNIMLLPEYEHGWPVTRIFEVYASTVTTARNDFSMAFDRSTLLDRINDLKDDMETDATLRQRYALKDVSYWNLAGARKELQGINALEPLVRPYCYRPLDFRFVFYHESVCERLRAEIMDHMTDGNIALLTHRPQSPGDFTFAYCTRMIGDQCVAANKTVGGGNSFQFPLFIKINAEKAPLSNASPAVGSSSQPKSTISWRSNLSAAFIEALQDKLGLSFVAEGNGQVDSSFSPENVFNYLYAIFHCPTYRSRYAQFLKSDFPRVPLTSDRDLFRALCQKGGELVALHLLESPLLNTVITRFPIPGDHRVEKGYPKFVAPGRVHINADQYFEGVPEDVWAFQIGGYQVAHKWLKDRQGRQLSYDDLTHYQKTITALHHTIRLMREIDALIPKWPLE